MRKIVKYDLKVGFNEVLWKIIIYVVIVALINIIGSNAIHNTASMYHVEPDVLDYVCFVIGGPRYIPSEMLSIYVIPVLWLIIQVMIAYTVGYYAITDLDRYGQQIVLRSSSRAKWWVGKVLWNVIMVSFMYFILYVVTFITAFTTGAKFDWLLTKDIVCNVCNLDMITGNKNEILVILFLMPVLVSITLCIIQMVCGLIFSPIIGFIASQSIVFLSTLYDFKWLISNYAMLSHNKVTCMSDIDYKEGFVLCLILFVAAVAGGMFYFMNCDILPKNQEI